MNTISSPSPVKPLVQEIPYADPSKLFQHFSDTPFAIFLDSSRKMPELGVYSYICISPFLTLTSKKNTIQLSTLPSNKTVYYHSPDCPFALLKKQLAHFPLQTHDNLPPFQGGAAGFLSYDLGQHLEKIPDFKIDDMGFDDMALGFYDLVIAFDNIKKQAFIFSSGYYFEEETENLDPEKQQLTKHEAHAHNRLNWLNNIINLDVNPNLNFNLNSYPPNISNPAISQDTLLSNFTKSDYCKAVETTRDYILSGDIFEGTVSQRFKAKLPENFNAYLLYQNLRRINPAPFSAYINLDNNTIIASASPERFLKLINKKIETRPIKGTRPRGKTPEQDKKLTQELQISAKDNAENIMIVDLMRNDLSKVCENHSVQVPKLCALESYATVHHLVSTVTGILKSEYTAVDLLKATFPGGSITGAPKIRAMEIIAALEPTSRGPYTGTIGYIGFDGNMDSSIVIRTYAIKNNTITYQAGSAITIHSDIEAEYQESLDKANALREALLF